MGDFLNSLKAVFRYSKAICCKLFQKKAARLGKQALYRLPFFFNPYYWPLLARISLASFIKLAAASSGVASL